MLKIAVCDDEIVFGKNVLEYIEQYMEKRQIPYKIQFFDSGKKLHKLTFFLMEREERKKFTLYGTLNDWEKKLQDDRWLRVHQSFLINMQYLLDVRNYFAELTDGSKLPVSKARYKQVRDQFAEYMGEV